jgi:endonuclease/exonuclease/phosphatase family metal-dependent hydrolase
MHDAEMSATDSSVPNIRTWHPAGARHEVEEGGSIDHIFGNSKVIFRNHKICYELDDEVAASDHYAVYADVKITP